MTVLVLTQNRLTLTLTEKIKEDKGKEASCYIHALCAFSPLKQDDSHCFMLCELRELSPSVNDPRGAERRSASSPSLCVSIRCSDVKL